MNNLSNLPIDIFIKTITYLPFSEVISVCNVNSKLHNYCSDFRYNLQWKKLIDDTFGSVHGYEDKLDKVREDLGLDDGTYNYLVYVRLIKELDPITQLMIYYRQGDQKSFDDPKFNKTQRFLALFLLGDLNNIEQYLPNNYYLPFIDMLKGKEITKDDWNNMMIKMAKQGNVKGVKMFLDKGADINTQDDEALRLSSAKGQLEVVKFLIQNGADIHAQEDAVLRWASYDGHLEVVKFLIQNGADIHADNDEAMRWASKEGHLEVVKFLIQNGADIHVEDDDALRSASMRGHLEVVKFLIQNGADIHAWDDGVLRLASMRGHLEVVKFLIQNGADIHAQNDQALRLASKRGHLEVVKYLKSLP